MTNTLISGCFTVTIIQSLKWVQFLHWLGLADSTGRMKARYSGPRMCLCCFVLHKSCEQSSQFSSSLSITYSAIYFNERLLSIQGATCWASHWRCRDAQSGPCPQGAYCAVGGGGGTNEIQPHASNSDMIVCTGLDLSQSTWLSLVTVIGSGMDIWPNWILSKWISGLLRKLPYTSSEFFPWIWTLRRGKAGDASATFTPLQSWAWSPAGACWPLLSTETNQTWAFQFHAAWYSLFFNLKPLS